MNTPWELFIPLLAGHIVGDFWLQTDIIVKNRKHDVLWIFIHAGIVALATWVIVGDFANIGVLLSVFVAHTLIDGGKRIVENLYDGKLVLQDVRVVVIDQLLHILSLFIIALVLASYSYYYSYWLEIFSYKYLQFLVLLSGLIFTVRAAGFMIDKHLSKFEMDLDNELKLGGQTIGRLERILIFIFVIVGIPQGIGFLIAAKSIFRIGELKKSEHRRQSEYIMIGSLYSFTYAILLAYITKYIIHWLG